ncbi:Tryptophan-associated transmembrane protein (Trp_oprn_chp) [Amycolatopsis tolypomycina]|uniref:Tryptophan-associated transmembrane protein (Trp_oprn_chp) n=2 Tax=Amycolatopsis tolypomycina TaxID=208445 RepID=A0A1H4QSV9_9PSEU|nr:Tryptophan-associated transmembrane protein (Trp_oprn_chp) [Amycolatopsis tolypomycina]
MSDTPDAPGQPGAAAPARDAATDAAGGAPATDAAAPAAKRPLWMMVVALLLGALALWGASRLTWFAEFRDGGVRGTVLYRETGEQRASALVPLALLALAGVAGLVATGGWARRVLGVVLALAGVAAVWLGVAGVRFSGYADGLPVTEMLLGRGLVVLGGILVATGGLAAVKGASRATRLGAKYAAPATRKKVRDPDAQLWDALSEGEDPTDVRGRHSE